MSHYRTPIRVHPDPTKNLQQKTSKYRLPFPKDEAPEERSFVVKELNQSYMITSQAKLNEGLLQKPKRTPSQKIINSQESKQYVEEQQQRDNSRREVVHLDDTQQYSNDTPEQSTPNQAVQRYRINKLQLAPRPAEPQQKIKNNSALPHKTNKHNSQTKYESDPNREGTHETDAQIGYPSPLQKISLQQLPSIAQKQRPDRNRHMHSSLKKQQQQLWQELSTQIEKSVYTPFRKHSRNKRIESRNRISKLSLSDSDNQAKLIDNQLRRRKQEEAEEDNREDMYASLPPISEQPLAEERSANHKQIVFLQHIKQAMESQYQSRKSKLKYSLQHYIDNYNKIKEFNPFFRKLNQLGGCVMLSIGKLKIVEAGHLLFTEGEPITHLTLIVLGKVVLTKAYNPLKKYALTGESLGEECLFDESKPYAVRIVNNPSPIFYKLQARAYSQVCLLRVKLAKYYKTCLQLSTIGEKGLFNLIDNLFRINYLKKHAAIHQQVRDRLQTEVLVQQKRKHSSSFFFH